MIMDVWIGLLIGCAVLFFFAYVELRKNEQSKLRVASFLGNFRDTKKGFSSKLLQRMFFETSIIKLPRHKLAIMSLFLFTPLSLILAFVENSLYIGLLFGLFATAVIIRLYVKSQYNKMQRRFERSLLAEAIPISAHSLSATDRLDEAIDEVGQLARSPRVRNEFQQLSIRWRTTKLTPSEALLQAAEMWDIPSMRRLALITKETEPFHPDLSKLWLLYGTRIEKEQYRERMLKAKTSAGRRNMMIFVSIVLILFLGAYPRFHEYLTESSQILFFVTIGLILLGTYLIWKTGEGLDV